jgi:outer membrane protein TolC
VDEARVRMTEAARKPDVTVLGEYRRMGDGGTPENDGVMAGIMMELPLRNFSRADLRAAEADRAASAEAARGTGREIAGRMAEQLAAHETSQHRLDAFVRGTLSARRRAWELAEGRFRAGKAPELEALDARRRWIEAQAGALDARRLLAVSAAQLGRILGLAESEPPGARETP